MPTFILIRPTVWPQYTKVTDRTGQTGQRSDSIGRTVLQTVAQTLHTFVRGAGGIKLENVVILGIERVQACTRKHFAFVLQHPRSMDKWNGVVADYVAHAAGASTIVGERSLRRHA